MVFSMKKLCARIAHIAYNLLNASEPVAITFDVLNELDFFCITKHEQVDKMEKMEKKTWKSINFCIANSNDWLHANFILNLFNRVNKRSTKYLNKFQS